MPAMLGPVTTAMRPPSPGAPERSQSLATNGSPRSKSAASHYRVAPALDGEAQRAVDPRPRPVALDGEFGEAGFDVQIGQRPSETPQGLGLPKRSVFERGEYVELQLDGAIGGRSDARLQVDQRLGSETHRALHGLAMDEGLGMRRFNQRLADGLRGLDEEAEEIVVLDLELARARRLGVAGLHLGDDAAAVVAQCSTPRRVRR